MWTNGVIGALILCFLTLGPLASVCQGTGDDLVPRPGVIEVSAVEQSAWLDQSIPKMMAAMRTSKEVRAKVAGPLVVEKVAPFLDPAAAGLAPGDLERWTALADAAVAANPRSGPRRRAKPQ